MAATATAVEVNQAQSIAMIRNLMRVTFSNVVYTRGIFDPSQFKPMNVGGVIVQTLSSESADENAKQLCEWMEQGAFKAMNDGYLDKCVLVISADAEEKVVLEAWSLSIGWSGELRVQVNDQERVLGPPSDKVKTGAISQSQVLKVSAVMLRSLHSMLQTMEMLPDQYFLSMKLTYREGTPSDYEPVGFVKSAGGLRFATRPIRMGVGPTIRTKHNSMGLDLLAEDAEGFETCEKIGQQVPSGGWAMEIGRLGPRVCQSDETKKVSVEDDRVVATAKALYADALDFARSLNPGERISTRQLVKKCSTDTATAEQLLQMLEKASLVSMYKPDRRSRVVLQEPEPEADETCMSETSADDESVAGGRSVAGTPAKPSPGGRSAHGSQTPSSASKPRGAASHLVARTPQRTPTRTPHTAPAHEPVRKRISKASSTSETIEFGAGKRGAQKSQASRR